MVNRQVFLALNSLLCQIGEVGEPPSNFDWDDYFKKRAILILPFENLELADINWFLKFLHDMIQNPLFAPHSEALRAALRMATGVALLHMGLYGTDLGLMFTIINSPHATEKMREEAQKALKDYLTKIEQMFLPPS